MNRPVLDMSPDRNGFRRATASRGHLVYIDFSSLYRDGKGAEQLGALETCLDVLSKGSVGGY